MGLRMLDSLSVLPVVALGFGYWLMKTNEEKEEERLRHPKVYVPEKSTGDKDLDAILGISNVAALITPQPKTS